MKNTTRRTAPALLVGLGLLLTFSGSATATHLITGKQIRDNSVTGQDLRDSGVTGAEVPDVGVTQQDLSQPVLGPEGAPVGPGSSSSGS